MSLSQLQTLFCLHTLCRFVKLALMVLHEKRMGASSLVAGYIAQLPESFQTPLHWTLEERSQLQYPHLESEVSDSCL